MKVYRYEDRNHVGPFTHIGLNRRFAQLPTAQEEGLPHTAGYASACVNTQALVHYFGINNCNVIEAKGYMMAEYEVEDVLTGDTQCVFRIDRAVFNGFIDEE